MANYREIVTKAVLGKGKKTFTTTNSITPEITPTTILGCWVINHNFRGYKVADRINIEGSYDVNIWYSCNEDTKTEVVRQNNSYIETVNVRTRNEADLSNEEIIVRGLKQPSCIKAEVINGRIEYTIEKELGVEIVGDTKVKIAYDEEEDPWDDLGEVMSEEKEKEVERQIDEQVNEEFL